MGVLVGNAVGHTGAGALTAQGQEPWVVRLWAMRWTMSSGIGAQIATNGGGKHASPGRSSECQRRGTNDACGRGTRFDRKSYWCDGVAGPLQSGDVIFLSQQGVHPSVIAAMQNPPIRTAAVPAVVPGPMVVESVVPAPIIVEEHIYGPPRYYRRPPYYHYPPPCGGVSWGVSVSH